MRSPGVKQDWVVELRLARLVGQLTIISRYRSNLKDHLLSQIHFDFVFRAELEFKPKKCLHRDFSRDIFVPGNSGQSQLALHLPQNATPIVICQRFPERKYPGKNPGEDIFLGLNSTSALNTKSKWICLDKWSLRLLRYREICISWPTKRASLSSTTQSCFTLGDRI